MGWVVESCTMRVVLLIGTFGRPKSGYHVSVAEKVVCDYCKKGQGQDGAGLGDGSSCAVRVRQLWHFIVVREQLHNRRDTERTAHLFHFPGISSTFLAHHTNPSPRGALFDTGSNGRRSDCVAAAKGGGTSLQVALQALGGRRASTACRITRRKRR